MLRNFMRTTIIALAAVGLFAAPGLAAENNAAMFKIGQAEVWAIADSVSERDMSVFPGVDAQTIQRYVPAGKTASSIMTFLIKLSDQIILVDTGLGNNASGLPDGLAAAGVKPEDITMVLLTHYHGDHIGGLAWQGRPAFPNAVVKSARDEYDYWLSDEAMAANPARKSGFETARRLLGLYAALDKNEVFEFGDKVAPGITALNAVGHTPGHTAFMLESDGARLLIWGDLIHAAALQFPRPDISPTYDMDPAIAAANRVVYLEMAAADGIPIAGMHLPFAAVGKVSKNPEGGYVFTPGL